jgi:nicotinamidase/pyrazinamidase
LQTGDALLIIDVQNDFLPGGALPVPDGDAIIGPLNAWSERFARAGLPIFASRDWHPANHCSFKAYGGPWPRHCVAHSSGAALAEGLRLPPETDIINKPCRPDCETYSAFTGTSLDAALRAAGVQRVWTGGLATDYCVLNTVLDALTLGYQVMLLCAAIRAVNVQPKDGALAMDRMVSRGAVLIQDAHD